MGEQDACCELLVLAAWKSGVEEQFNCLCVDRLVPSGGGKVSFWRACCVTRVECETQCDSLMQTTHNHAHAHTCEPDLRV